MKTKKLLQNGTFCVILVTIVICLMLLFTACQPTPEKEVVINKNDGRLEEAIANTSQPAADISESIFEVWNETVQNSDGGDFIKINAEIILPEADALPVISIQPTGFTQTQVDNIIQYFSVDGIIYSSDEVLTQEEILERIITIESEYARFKNGDDGFDSGITAEYFEQQLDKYRAILDEAPSELEREESTSELLINDESGHEELEIRINVGNSDLARITVLNQNQHNYSSAISLSSGNRYGPNEDLYGQNASGIDTTLEQAKEFAEKILEGLGLNDYVVKEVFTGNLFNDENKQGYIIICTPQINKILVTYSEMTKIDDPNIIDAADGTGRLIYADTGETVEYVPRRFDESYIEICVDNTGFTSLIWKNISELLSIENENVEILDFEEIKRIFIQQMESNFIYNNHENGIVYTVNRIELGIVSIPQR